MPDGRLHARARDHRQRREGPHDKPPSEDGQHGPPVSRGGRRQHDGGGGEEGGNGAAFGDEGLRKGFKGGRGDEFC